jgi:hypothetical protein
LSEYSIRATYSPDPTDKRTATHGLVQESPKCIEEHALFRALREKGRQFRPEGQIVVCVGSDQSPVLSRLGGGGRCTSHQAVSAAFWAHRSLAAAFIVSIENSLEIFAVGRRCAEATLVVNQWATYPFTDGEIDLLLRMDFNRWTYSRPLEKWEPAGAHRERQAIGTMTVRSLGMSYELEIPAPLVIDALAGKRSLVESMRLRDDDPVTRILKEGWTVESCTLSAGRPETAEASKIVLRMSPPFPGVLPQPRHR